MTIGVESLKRFQRKNLPSPQQPQPATRVQFRLGITPTLQPSAPQDSNTKRLVSSCSPRLLIVLCPDRNSARESTDTVHRHVPLVFICGGHGQPRATRRDVICDEHGPAARNAANVFIYYVVILHHCPFALCNDPDIYQRGTYPSAQNKAVLDHAINTGQLCQNTEALGLEPEILNRFISAE